MAASAARLVSRSPFEILDDIRDNIKELELSLLDAPDSEKLRGRLCRSSWDALHLEDTLAIARLRLAHPSLSRRTILTLRRRLQDSQTLDFADSIERRLETKELLASPLEELGR